MQSHFPSRRGFLGLLGASLAYPALARASGVEAISGNAFGTTWSVVGPTGSDLGALWPALDALFKSIDADLSPWRPDSGISRFNASATGMAGSVEMIRVTRAALRLAMQSDGAFDPTVGPAVARWGFGPIERGGSPDWRGIRVQADTISKARGDLTLDLCGIAKGRALDRAVDLAASQGHDNILFDLGGELLALGQHPVGRDWQVAVEHPLQGQPAAVLHLPGGMAVATSGLSAQSYSLGTRHWGHIIDPATISPVQGHLRAVTVLADAAMTADGWATALFAAGDEAGPALARDLGLAALFLFDDGSTLRRVKTGAIGELLI